MDNAIVEKSEAFALRMVKLYQHLTADKHEYVLSKQALRSGTSIGANVCEANYGQTKADFYAKMSIALKESAETEYWLKLLHKSGYITADAFASIHADCVELIKILTAIVKTRNQRSNR